LLDGRDAAGRSYFEGLSSNNWKGPSGGEKGGTPGKRTIPSGLLGFLLPERGDWGGEKHLEFFYEGEGSHPSSWKKRGKICLMEQDGVGSG